MHRASYLFWVRNKKACLPPKALWHFLSQRSGTDETKSNVKWSVVLSLNVTSSRCGFQTSRHRNDTKKKKNRQPRWRLLPVREEGSKASTNLQHLDFLFFSLRRKWRNGHQPTMWRQWNTRLKAESLSVSVRYKSLFTCPCPHRRPGSRASAAQEKTSWLSLTVY